jgi:hypothetical protein
MLGAKFVLDKTIDLNHLAFDRLELVLGHLL